MLDCDIAEVSTLARDEGYHTIKRGDGWILTSVVMVGLVHSYKLREFNRMRKRRGLPTDVVNSPPHIIAEIRSAWMRYRGSDKP